MHTFGLTLPVLRHTPLLLPPHEPTANREEYRVYHAPRNQNPKVKSNARMQPEQDLATPLNNCYCVSSAISKQWKDDLPECSGHAYPHL
jgi:hypothetical protein